MIFYFSGTGNSRWVAEQLAQKLSDRLIPISESCASGQYSYSLADGEMLGFVFPTYSWGPAPVMVDFIKQMEISGYNESTFVYMVTTCGDDVGLSVDVWRKALGNINGCAAYSVQMPNNYILFPGFDVDSKELEEKKKHDAVKRVELIAEKLKQRLHVVDVVEGACAWLKSRVVYPWFRRYSMTDKKFVVDSDKCTHCGVCVKSCPMQNITQKAGEIPRWHGNCAMCLACIHRCPVRAIEYAKATQNKGRYYFKQS